MEDNLVIVESPAKAKTIENFLGKDFLVKSSFGHIRDLSKKNLGIDINNNFKPEYIISEDKKKVVTELKKLAKKAKTVWLASDEDREGEAIAWHLSEVLELPPKKIKRIVFHEITKNAILNAIENPRDINSDLVNAQQARRILDRLVGFELSPLLWKKIKPSLSAGRVQSVAVRLLVEREREIISFNSTSSFKISFAFLLKDKDGKDVDMIAELPHRIKTKEETVEFLKKCIGAEFEITNIVKKPSKKSPSSPFTTSTLQQEASRKLGFSVAQTMRVAQNLYESGKITYMRTDSVNLSESILSAAVNIVKDNYGEKYSQTRRYKTKSKGAQEAHEAIRPTYLDKPAISGNHNEKRLYDLIYKRTIASQMSDAQLEKTNVTIGISTLDEHLVATGEVIKFDGFLRVYTESSDDETEEKATSLLPPLEVNQKLQEKSARAVERFTHHPPRYTEASLVKKLEELGIGRPSTYAPTISTIQQRGYVVKEDREGREREYYYISLENNKINEAKKTETTGAEKAKLFPDDIGMLVNDFLVEYFQGIMDYNFTARVERDFDEIAEGKQKWPKMLKEFYDPFHKKVETTEEKSDRSRGERHLGTDTKSGKPVIVRMGRYGPIVQIGETSDEEKPKFASLLKGQHIETISLDDALELFKLPRDLGKYEDSEVVVGIGRFGPYVRHKSKFYSLKKGIDDPLTIELNRAIELIEAKREQERKKVIKTYKEDETMKVLNGRYGPYISHGKENYRIPKKTEPEKLTYEDSLKIIEESKKKGKSKSKRKNTPGSKK